MATYGSTEPALDVALKAPSKLAAVEDDYEDEPEGFMEHAAPYVAEFVGTFLIVFTMGCCSVCGNPLWNPTAVAFSVVVAVYSVGPISGGHLNPAVTLCLGFVLKFPWAKMLGYMIMQVAGAFTASLAYWAIFSKTIKLGPPQDSHWAWYDLGIIEALYTFTLCFVFINCVASNRNNRAGDQNHFFGLAVGFVYIAGGYPALNISGGIFNPAAALALGVTGDGFAGKGLYWTSIYILAQTAGAWLASVIFAIVRPEDFKLQYDGQLEAYEVPIRAKLMAELVGTFVIVVTVGLNLVMVTPAGAWSTAASYVSLIYALGDVSGGHFNPAITFAVMLSRRGKCSIPLAQTYILQQLLGGVLAGVVYSHYDIVGPRLDIPLEPKPGYGWGQAGMAETLFTALLAFTFLSVATTNMPPSTTNTNFYFGLAVGTCITIGGFSIGSLSGWSLNPAVALGRAIAQVISLASIHQVAQDWSRFLHCVWYALFEFAGGLLAACVFFMTHQKEYVKDIQEGSRSLDVP